MDREMKKLLSVALSVGVFLLVTIIAAIVILTPKVHTEEVASSSSRPITVAQSRPNQDANPLPPTVPLPTVSPVISNTQETNLYMNGESAGTNNGDRVIQAPKPIAAGVPDTGTVSPAPAAKPAVSVAPATPAVQSAPAAKSTPVIKPAPVAKPTAKPAPAPAATPAVASKPVAKPVVQPATAAKPKNDYWVQTGAFAAQVRAEDAKEKLASNGITSIIENRLIDGKTLYRVRLGPYTSEGEANYWLALVKTIDGFTDSQIRQTPSVR
jgi:DedD protein